MRIIYIDIDTLRYDHMSCYGYYRNTTPHIDAIAREGVRFDNCYCSDAPCLPSRAALITGRFSIVNGAVGHGGSAADPYATGPARQFQDRRDLENFTHIFRRAGYHTVSFSTFGERHSAYWFDAGFQEICNVGKGGMESGEEVLAPALDWLARNGSKDQWYMHFHLWDPHTPYRTPAGYESPFADRPFESWIDEATFARHQKHVGPHSINELNMYDDGTHPEYPKQMGSISEYARLRDVFDRYDEGIHYSDQLVGRLLDKLRELGVFEDTAVVVTSDHGENYGELGIYAEHATADESTCHIPLIIKWPGCGKGTSEPGLYYQLDLTPTVAELLHVEASKQWSGTSFAQALKNGAPSGRDHLVLSQMAHVCQRSARFDRYLYIRTIHDGYHLFDREMLFDLKEDPHETRNLAQIEPGLCAKGAKMILDFIDEQMKRSASGTDPLWTVMRENGPYHTWNKLDAYLARLKATGREEGARLLYEEYKRD